MSQKHRKQCISIITVVRNGASDLARTIASIRRQHNPNLEYLVIDGASTDNTIEVIKDNADIIYLWLSEQDKGIYDAMNKGIERARGEYLLFLNAGDELVVDSVDLTAVLEEGHIVVYGRCNMLHENGELSYVKGKPLTTIGKLVRGTPLCHQAILYRRDSIGRYDTRYRIIADRVLTYELVKRFGLEKTRFVDTVIANYYEGGFSRHHVEEWKDEEFQFQRKAGWHLFAAYRRLSWLFKKNLTRTVQR